MCFVSLDRCCSTLSSLEIKSGKISVVVFRSSCSCICLRIPIAVSFHVWVMFHLLGVVLEDLLSAFRGEFWGKGGGLASA